jgi:hypothetical protein
MISSSELLVKKNMQQITDNAMLYSKAYPQTVRIHDNQDHLKVFKSTDKKVSFS